MKIKVSFLVNFTTLFFKVTNSKLAVSLVEMNLYPIKISFSFLNLFPGLFSLDFYKVRDFLEFVLSMLLKVRCPVYNMWFAKYKL